MLALSGVTAGYGAIDVVSGIDLAVMPGESVALLGPNGAGKSTLLAAVTGTIGRRGGRILFDGEDLLVLPSHRIVARGVRLVPEGRLIFAPYSVEDNLRLGAMALRVTPERTLRSRFDEVFALFPRLAERRRQTAGTMSGGEQQMLAIGRALMSAPRMLLLDEPFLGVAPLIVEEIGRALRCLRDGGLTLLIVEQKLDIAFSLAERAYVMIKGRIVLEDYTVNLKKRSDLASLYFALATG